MGHDLTPLGMQSGHEIAVSFPADASRLSAAWNALTSLADVAGEVSINAILTASSGHYRVRIEDGVLELLRELGRIQEGEG